MRTVFPLRDRERTAVQEGRVVLVNTTLAELVVMAEDLGIRLEALHVHGEIAPSSDNRASEDHPS